MVDVVSIIVAVVSLTGTIIAIIVTTYFAYLTDERKRRQELNKFFAKYKDALLLAAQDLQSRLKNITDLTVMDYYQQGGPHCPQKDSLLLYTTFVVGQYLCWIWIIRQQAQFLQFETLDATRDVTVAITSITAEFGTDQYEADLPNLPFMLWRGEQMAIGEVMLREGGGEISPIGYAEFHKKWTEGGTVACLPPARGGVDSASKIAAYWSGQFRPWFRPIIDGIIMIGDAKAANAEQVPDQRLRRLQHRLIDLIWSLDPKGLGSENKWRARCSSAEKCGCRDCENKNGANVKEWAWCFGAEVSGPSKIWGVVERLRSRVTDAV